MKNSDTSQLEDKLDELDSQNKSLHQQNLDLQKKVDILEETVNYYKTAFADSQKSIQEVSQYSKQLKSENDRLLKKIAKLETK